MLQSIKLAIIKKIENNLHLQKALKKGKIFSQLKELIIKNLKIKNEEFNKYFEIEIDLQRKSVLIYVRDYNYFYPLFELRNLFREKINKSFKKNFSIREVAVLRKFKK